jgi:hypothetical protein
MVRECTGPCGGSRAADLHLADHDPEAAGADVERVLQVHFPAGSPEGEEARLDA